MNPYQISFQKLHKHIIIDFGGLASKRNQFTQAQAYVRAFDILGKQLHPYSLLTVWGVKWNKKWVNKLTIKLQD